MVQRGAAKAGNAAKIEFRRLLATAATRRIAAPNAANLDKTPQRS
jgi:hypothetical protein